MQSPAKFLVIVDSGGAREALMVNARCELVADFDAAIEEVALMTRGLRPETGASGPEWDRLLAGRSAAERATAEVYTLDV